MEHPALRGRSILVVETEILIAMDIAQALERAGANPTMTTTVRHALILIEHDGLSAAIMDHALSDGDSTKLCARPNAASLT
jgi:DNA-binding response OmpR family regulator